MGFFEDRSREAYDRAAHAVQNGTASAEQRRMNAKMAKTAGREGNKALAAEQGRLKDDKKGCFCPFSPSASTSGRVHRTAPENMKLKLHPLVLPGRKLGSGLRFLPGCLRS